jgi:hypothetical protein
MGESTKLLRAALAAASLLAGCAEATPEPAPPVTPSLHPRPVVWDQFCEQAWSVPQANELTMARGSDGWELVAMYNGVLCYKRPRPDARREVAHQAPFATPGAAFVPAVQEPGF